MVLPEVFEKSIEPGLARGHRDISKLDGALVMKIDENWTIAMNGHRKAVDVPPEDGLMGCSVLPFEMAVFWNGWLAGIVSGAGGELAAGDLANEDTLCDALADAIAREKAL